MRILLLLFICPLVAGAHREIGFFISDFSYQFNIPFVRPTANFLISNQTGHQEAFAFGLMLFVFFMFMIRLHFIEKAAVKAAREEEFQRRNYDAIKDVEI